MFIKKFVYKTMPQAMDAIKQELGSDAVILSSRRIRAPGILGWFGAQWYEVVAAVDSAKVQDERGAIKPERLLSQAQSPAQVPHQIAAGALRDMSTFQSDGPALPPVLLRDSALDRDEIMKKSAPNDPSTKRLDVAAMTQPRSSAGEPLDRAVVSTVAFSDSLSMGDSTAQLARDIKDLRMMIATMVAKDADPEASELGLLLTHWRETGMSATLIKKFEDLYGSVPSANLGDLIAQFIEQTLVLPTRTIRADDRCVLFLGPTGVGKTTTIAKLAAQARLRDRRKVGLLTVDTFRIAAVEQLGVYATILNVPVVVAKSPEEIPGCLEQLASCDLILVDTTGRSYLDQQAVLEHKEVIGVLPVDLCYAVLSLNARYAETKQMLTALSTMHVDALLFTKHDESMLPSLGLSMSAEFNKPLSYITNGQHVPNDLFEADLHTMISIFQRRDERGGSSRAVARVDEGTDD